ncbi:hypothetical protein ZOSMA_139G00400 [Zostera marina]|uniref:Uncharacterized protein n=1 Tax=Zostera marina TaxID=29655 RepID=A0A0K9Q0D0_ZOSMR|nr:hypothetical protein ZOSMA_139G00400 [Zostera marina]
MFDYKFLTVTHLEPGAIPLQIAIKSHLTARRTNRTSSVLKFAANRVRILRMGGRIGELHVLRVEVHGDGQSDLAG